MIPIWAIPIIIAPNAAPTTDPYPPVSRQPPTTAAMMNSNSRPTPSLLCMPRRLTAVITPQSAATVEVAMKRAIFVLDTGTPMLRAATGSPPAPKIQLPTRVRARTHAPPAVSPSHQRTEPLRPYVVSVDANSLCAVPKPGAWSMSLIETPPVILIVKPALMPRSMKNVPSVMMKLGSRVLTTVTPLRKPIAIPNRRQTTIAGQMFQPYFVVRMPSSNPELPIITPAERANSPPIMSSATGTATMPSYAATLSQLLQMPKSPAQLTFVVIANS